MVHRRLLVLVVAGVVALAGACGGDGDAGTPAADEAAPSGGGGNDDGNGNDDSDDDGGKGEPGGGLYGPVCDLLTATDVEEVLGSAAETDEGDEDLGACHFTLSDGVTIVTFQVMPAHGFDASVEAFSESASFQDVDGLGERATFSADAFSGGYLVAVEGERMYSVSGAGSLDGATGLMERILERA